MSLRFHWFPPANGDSRDIVGGGHGAAVGAASAIRPATTAYLGQIARSAEQLGFAGALTPSGAWCEDAWLSTAMLTGVTERLKFLVAFRPGLVGPALAAEFILSGYPHLEEAYWFGEGVLPLLERCGHWRHPFPASPQPASPHPSAKEKVTAR